MISFICLRFSGGIFCSRRRTTFAGISSIRSTVSSRNIPLMTFSSSVSENAFISSSSSSPSMNVNDSAARSFGRTRNISGMRSRGASDIICAISAGSRSSSSSLSSVYLPSSASSSASSFFSSIVSIVSRTVSSSSSPESMPIEFIFASSSSAGISSASLSGSEYAAVSAAVFSDDVSFVVFSADVFSAELSAAAFVAAVSAAPFAVPICAASHAAPVCSVSLRSVSAH